MIKLEFKVPDNSITGLTQEDAVTRHAKAYSNAILRALEELASGGSIGIRNGRKRCGFSLLKCRLGPVKGCGLCYIKLVLKLFEEYDLLTALPDKLGDCAIKLKCFDEQVRMRFPATKIGKKKCQSVEVTSYLAAKEVIRKLFDYDRFCGGQGLAFGRDGKNGPYIAWTHLKNWSAWDMIHELDVDVCAYCNADAVFALRIDQQKAGVKNTFQVKELRKRSPLDHFYGYSEYPCLGLSLYNLVPACTRCNTNIKGAKKQDIRSHIHPYRESFDDGIRFYALFKDYASLTFQKEDSRVMLVLRSPMECEDAKLMERARASAEFFHLEEVYNQTFKRELVDAVRRIIALPNSYLEDLRDRFPGIGELVLNRTLIGCSLERGRINNERLSKMACDLNDQLRVATMDAGSLAEAFQPS